MRPTLTLIGFACLTTLVDCTRNNKETAETGGDHNTDPSPDCTVREWQLVAAGYLASCGIHIDGCMECWGNDFGEDDWDIVDMGDADPPEGEFTSVAMAAVSVGGNDVAYTKHACAIAANDSSAVCWGNSAAGRTEPVPGAYELLTLGYFESCGLTTNGNVNCWPGLLELNSSHTYTHIDAGYEFICGITTEGEIDCEGKDWGGTVTTPPPGNKYTQVATAIFRACALDLDGEVTCWGSSASSTTEFSGPVKMLDIDEHATCGILEDGHIECPDRTSVWEMPEGTFAQISVGRWHACAVTIEGEMKCWGQDLRGAASPPE